MASIAVVLFSLFGLRGQMRVRVRVRGLGLGLGLGLCGCPEWPDEMDIECSKSGA